MLVAVVLWGTLAVLLGLLWLGGFITFVIGRRRNSRGLMVLGAVPLGLSTLAILGGGAATVSSLVHFNSPRNVYASAFGFPPSPDVTNLNSSYFQFGDSGEVYLRFNASSQTIQRIAARGLKKLTPSQVEQNVSSHLNREEAPPWWQPQRTRWARCYGATRRGGDFASESEFLLYDEKSGTAFYHYFGVD